MAFNAFMHPRNIYKDNPPNFKELAAKYPDFKKFCSVDLGGKITIDFKNSESVRALTQALLRNDFDLDVELPSDSLVPRIPLRLNYILWLEDLVEQIAGDRKTKGEIWGIDIGTGASCIYPLLGAKRAGWHFLATERDAVSVEVARRNVERNGLRHLIEVIKVDEHTALCGVVEDFHDRTFDFCMCNPPFYDVSGELSYCASAGRPGRPEPHSATVAKLNEVCAEGGEIGFVSRIIDDSVKLGQHISIYTSMIGKKASLGPLKAKLRESKAIDMCVATFSQGKTQRWALAWTFATGVHLKPINSVTTKKRPPQLLEVPPNAVQPYTFEKVVERLLRVMDELEIKYVEVESSQRSVLSRSVRYAAEAKRNTWAHNRRKRRAMERLTKEDQQKVPKMERNGTSSKAAVDHCHDKGNGSVQSQCEAAESGIGTSTSDRMVSQPGTSINDVASGKADRIQQISDASDGCMLKFDFTIKLWDTKIVLELQFVDGDPDALHQILQFLKNRFH